MKYHDLDNLFTSARNIPVETSANEIATWVAAAGTASTGVLGVAAKLKLFIVKKSIVMLGLTLGTIGAVVLATTLSVTPTESKKEKPVIVSQFIDADEEVVADLDDTTDVIAPKILSIPPPPPPKPVEPQRRTIAVEPMPPMPPKNIVHKVTIVRPQDVRTVSTNTVVIIPPKPPKDPKPCVPHPSCNGSGKKISGNGEVVVQNRDVSSFTELVIDGLFDVYITQGSKEKVTVETDSNLQEMIITKNDGNKLIVKNGNANFDKVTKMRIDIVVKDLSKLTAEGIGSVFTESTIKSSDLELKIDAIGSTSLKLNCENLDINFDGIGSLNLEGKANYVTMNCDGVGSIKAYDLIVSDMDIKHDGVGSAKVNVTNDLDINLKGVGSVYYKGKPKSKHIDRSGIGTVKEK